MQGEKKAALEHEPGEKTPFHYHCLLLSISLGIPAGLECHSSEEKGDSGDGHTHVHAQITLNADRHVGREWGTERERGVVIKSCESTVRDLTFHSCIILISININ